MDDRSICLPYGFRSVPGPELTEEELDAIAEAADCFYENLACG